MVDMHLAIEALSLASLQVMQLKQKKQIFQINITSLNIHLAGSRPVGYLRSMTEDLNSGLPRTKSHLWLGGGLELGTSGLQHRRPKPLRPQGPQAHNAKSQIDVFFFTFMRTFIEM